MTITPYTHDTPEWHALRARNVGASEVASLILDRDQLPAYAPGRYALYHIKAGSALPPEVSNQRIRFGLRLEPVIAECAAEDQKWPGLRKGGFATDDKCPGLSASLDYEIDPGPEELALGWAGPGALECKNTDWLIHRRAWTDGEPPLHISIQLQAQMAASSYTWGAVACLIGGNEIAVYRYPAKPPVIALIRQRVTEFWASIAEGREPPVDGSDAAAAVIRALYPEQVDEEADLTHVNEGPEACAAFLDAQERKKAASEDYDLARNRLALLLGGSKRAKFTGYRASFSVAAEKPDRVAEPGELIKGRRESRTYRVKEAA